MKEKSIDSFSLEGIFRKRGITLYHEDGKQREVVDVIEDLYIRLNPRELISLFFEIGEEEDLGNNLFEEQRKMKEHIKYED